MTATTCVCCYYLCGQILLKRLINNGFIISFVITNKVILNTLKQYFSPSRLTGRKGNISKPTIDKQIYLIINKKVIAFVFLEQVDMAYKVEGDAKEIGDHEFLDLKAFKFRFLGDGIKSAYITNNDVVRGSPALSK